LKKYRLDPFLSPLPTGALAKFVCTAGRGALRCLCLGQEGRAGAVTGAVLDRIKV
jgi:hypothetical protein